jgi:hypothetical protein
VLRVQEVNMELRKIVVHEVFSPGTVRGDDGHTYVLKGVPDGADDLSGFAAARRIAEELLMGHGIYIEEALMREMPELPGFEITPLDSTGLSMVPELSARVAGAFVGHPMPTRKR